MAACWLKNSSLTPIVHITMQQGKKGTAYIGAPLKWDFLWQPTNEKMPSDREPQKVECNKKPAPFGPLCHCKFWSFLYLWRRVTKIFSSVWFLIRFISINEITLCLDTNEIQPKCHQIFSKFHLNLIFLRLQSIYFPGMKTTWPEYANV